MLRPQLDYAWQISILHNSDYTLNRIMVEIGENWSNGSFDQCWPIPINWDQLFDQPRPKFCLMYIILRLIQHECLWHETALSCLLGSITICLMDAQLFSYPSQWKVGTSSRLHCTSNRLLCTFKFFHLGIVIVHFLNGPG